MLLFLPISLMALATPESAADSTPVPQGQIQVRVTFDNHRSVGEQLRVDLLNQALVPTHLTFTDSAGRAWFRVQQSGQYRVRVSGHNIQEATSDEIRVDQFHQRNVAVVQVRPRVTIIYNVKTKNAALASATDLGASLEARKYFHDGLQAIQSSNYQKAFDLFEKAIRAYPRYDTAYNNLGVACVQLNKPDKAWIAFQQAVQINDRNADADRNLARLLIQTSAYERALTLLQKSLMVDPLNPSGLTLAANAELASGKYDDALRDAQKVHELPHEGFAASHYFAGQAFEHKNELQEARAEYELYLLEDPNGPEASDVKNALGRVMAADTSIAQRNAR